MSLTRVLFLVAAGVGGGLAGSVAGLASVVSYPALLAIGLSPLAANVTNTVALVGSASGSFLGSRRELQGQRPLVRRLALPVVLGGLTGGALLLLTPRNSFQLVVPELIGLASVGILLRPRSLTHDTSTAAHSGRALLVVTFVIAVYGGYFGAAAGVAMLAVLLASSGQGLARSNAVKNVLLGLANLVAAVVFAIFAPVHWAAALPLGVGFLAGGRIGPVIVRRAPADLLRRLIACAGIALAVHLALDAYH